VMQCFFKRGWIVVAALAVGAISGIAQHDTAVSAPGPKSVPGLKDTSQRGLREYHLHTSDSMDVKFPYSPEFDQSVTVQPDGRVRLREIQAIVAAGLTPSELEEKVSYAYAGILNKPSVSIVLRDFQKPSFFASGEVGKPGRYDLREDVSLLQAIAEAGGMINERAKKKQVILFRPQHDGTYESQSYDMAALLKSHEAEAIPILPGDVIYVPQNFMSKIQKFLPTASMGASMTPPL
jgi:polysaccharide export outer membrane protein